MSQLNIQIEDRLHAAGYRTERIAGVVNVFDPVHASIPGSSVLVVTHWDLNKICSMAQARAFIEPRL